LNRKTMIYVIDDDASVRTSLIRLLKLEGFTVDAFSSAEDFLSTKTFQHPGCVISDLRMPGLSGLELQEVCAKRGINLPIIFVTGYGQVAQSVQAMKQGAVDFLTKPYSKEALLQAVEQAVQTDEDLSQQESAALKTQRRLDTLSEREREVLNGIIAGKLNKQIAFKLGIAEKTVKFHRANIMAKMKVDSLAHLVRLVN